MKIVFVSNFLNHHQIPICKEYLRLADEFWFVSTDSSGSQGFQVNTEAEYVLHYDMKEDNDKAVQKIIDADIAIMGSCPNELVELRAKTNKLTYIYSERLFKKGIWRRFIPRTRKCINSRFLKCSDKNVYVLAASAYLPFDLSLIGFPLNKVLKWGYFPQCKEYENIEELINNKKKHSILWVGRFLQWKHPEYAIGAVYLLKKRGYSVELNMIGEGECFCKISDMIKKLSLEDCVFLHGSKDSVTVRSFMEKSEVFLFTSDKKEGWGAVLNEAMNSGCAVVASDGTGAAPWLIEHKKNGMIYKSGNVNDLFLKTKMLLDDCDMQRSIGREAYLTIKDQWNEKNAAERLVDISKNLIEHKDYEFQSGVCSKVPIIKNRF